MRQLRRHTKAIWSLVMVGNEMWSLSQDGSVKWFDIFKEQIAILIETQTTPAGTRRVSNR
jgi:hypothetical protein